MKVLSLHLVFLATLALVAPPTVSCGQAPKPNSETILDRKLSHFPHNGSFDELLGELAFQLRPTGIVGVETDSTASATSLALSLDEEPSAREVLTKLCAADHKHSFELAGDVRVVNVLLIKSNKLTELLERKVPQFDMNTDAWPMNWYGRLPDFSPEIRTLLENRYRQSGQNVDDGGPGASLETGMKPPHIELHLRNTTIRGILNALAVKNLDWALNYNSRLSTSSVSYPTFPNGWQAELRPTRDVGVGAWIGSVFSPFPSRNNKRIEN